ncbi:hypothetical protein C8R48DRAFT_679480 [Suillus tomentosus]|nr:hypothetical protein C8R48DRAFT_679480 [Suillus tomentosus]
MLEKKEKFKPNKGQLVRPADILIFFASYYIRIPLPAFAFIIHRSRLASSRPVTKSALDGIRHKKSSVPDTRNKRVLRANAARYISGLRFASLIGTPTCGALLTSSYTWWVPALFSGIVSLVGSMIFIFKRYTFLRNQRVQVDVRSLDGQAHLGSDKKSQVHGKDASLRRGSAGPDEIQGVKWFIMHHLMGNGHPNYWVVVSAFQLGFTKVAT